MSAVLKFQCWNCKGNRIEEAINVKIDVPDVILIRFGQKTNVDVVQYVEIKTIIECGDIDYDGKSNSEEGVVGHYQCIDCGEEIGDGTIDTKEKLANYLKEKCKQD